MIIFVTGATGFIGRRFLPCLLARLAPHDQVYALMRTPEPVDDPRVVPLAGGLGAIDAQADILRKSDWVYHLAADATFGAGAHYQEVNVQPVERMVAILKQAAGLKRFVLVSTIGVLDRVADDRISRPLTTDSVPAPTSDYGRSKLAGEQILRSSGLPFTIIRPGWVYGPGMRPGSHLNVMARKIADRPSVARLNPPGRVPLIQVDDLAMALVRCLDEPAAHGRTYIAVTENRAIGEILAQLHLAIHRRPVGMRLPWPRCGWAFRRWHSRLPLTLTNLFVDYLAAEDPLFQRDLLPREPVLLEKGLQGVAGRFAPDAGWWLVTGANSGIGFALMAALRAKGRRVIAVDRTVGNLAPSGDLIVIEVDLGDRDALARVAHQVRGMQLAGLINNAGVGYRGGLLELDWEQAERTVRVNILAALELTHLLRAQLRRDGTTIVNIASSVAYHALPHMSVYAASKAFILSWSLALSEELRASNRVITFSPSGTRTNFQRSGNVKGAGAKDLMAPEVVAQAILRAAEAGRRHQLLGFKSRVLVMGSYFLPIRFRLALWRMLFGVAR